MWYATPPLTDAHDATPNPRCILAGGVGLQGRFSAQGSLDHRSVHRACVSDLAPVDRAHVGRVEGYNGNRIASERGELHLVAGAALGIDPRTAADDAEAEAEDQPPAKAEAEPNSRPKTSKSREPKAPRKDSKQAHLIAMLRRAKGATIDEVVDALEWQPHTVRGAIAGALKKKLGLDVTSDKVEGRGRVYRLARSR